MPRNNDDLLIGGFGQPAQNVDATGRMIRDSAPPVPHRKPTTGIAPPAYRKYVFSGHRAQEWEDWTRMTELDHGLSSAGKRAFRDIFAAEGGMEKNKNSSAVGGIMQRTLSSLKNQGFIDHLAVSKTTDLNMRDLKKVYKAHFDDVFHGAARTAGIPGQGHKLLGTIGDDEVASVTADTLFRDDYSRTSEYVQKAINKALPKDQHVMIGGGPGSQTLNGLRAVAKDPQRKRIFLEALGDIRDQKFLEPGDPARNEYYRFRR